MTKTVYTGREVPHIYAHGTIPAARNSNGTLWFEDGTLFSYRQPIAHKMPDGSYLVSADSFSVTTSKHQAWARYALNHCRTVDVPELKMIVEILTYRNERTALDFIKARVEDAETIRAKLSRMRSDWKKSQANAEIAQHESACAIVWQALGKRSDWRNAAAPALAKRIKADKRAMYTRAMDLLTHMLEDGARIAINGARSVEETHLGRQFMALENAVRDIGHADYLGALLANRTPNHIEAEKIMGKAWIRAYDAAAVKLAEIVESLQPEIAAAKSAYDAALLVRESERLEKWLSGESNTRPQLREIVCRVINGDTVETSQGARVPLEDALRVVAIARQCRDKGQAFARETIATGPYKGLKVDNAGNVTIGCHYLTWEAISDCVARFKPEVLA